MTQPCPHCSAANRHTAQFCAQCSQPLRQICASCGADNPPRSRFCNKCGAQLAQWLHCPQCDRVNPAGSLFCNGCGTALSPDEQPSSDLAPPARYVGTGHLAPQTKLAGRYVILRRVGRGGMGAVYQAADDRITGKMWAIKEMSDAAIIDPREKQQALDGFRQEAVMLATLDHPNLPKVTDHFSEGGKQYLVMDFIEGETLEERVDREPGKPLPVDEVLGWAEQLCDVLAYLHRREPPVIFRDLKPGNVMVTPDGMIKLIDFGIARLFKPGKATDTAFFGTAGYSPREQYGRGQTDARSDVYALGATLYHLLTGDDPTDHPFDFKDAHHLNAQVSEHAAGVIAKALAQDPADRWQSVREMQRALAEKPKPKPASESKPAPIQPPPSVSAPPRPVTAAAQAATVSAPAAAAQPSSVPAASRLNFWSGTGLVVLGVVLFGVVGRFSHLNTDFIVGAIPLAFVPALFGILFGPWVGLGTGFVGEAILLLTFFGQDIFHYGFDPGFGLILGGLVFSGGVMGIMPAWMVKDARDWRVTLGVGGVASLVMAIIVASGISIANDYWGEFFFVGVRVFLVILPANVTLLPFFARSLVEPSGRWRVIGWGIAATLLWAATTSLGIALLHEAWEYYWNIVWDAVLVILPVSAVLVPLIAFWLSGSVRRWGLYWRDYQ